MDLFVSNLDNKLSKPHLEASLAPILLNFNIKVFGVQKTIGRPKAILTIADRLKARRVLTAANQNLNFFCSPSGRPASFQVSRFPVDKFRLRALAYEEKSRNSVKAWQKSAANSSKAQTATRGQSLEVDGLHCGRWEVKSGSRCFQPYYKLSISGRLKKDEFALVVDLEDGGGKAYELLMHFSNIRSIAVGKHGESDILVIALNLPPTIVADRFVSGSQEALNAAFMALQIGPKLPSKIRISTLPDQHQLVAGSCHAYSLILSQPMPGLLLQVRHLVPPETPVFAAPRNSHMLHVGNFPEQVSRLNTRAEKMNCSFGWRFQLQALWANGSLSPAEVMDLLPVMVKLRKELGEAALLKALERLALQLMPLDPSAKVSESGVSEFKTAFEQQSSFLFKSEEDMLDDEGDGILIHRIVVTPAGSILSGPHRLAANRVLRQYRQHAECFVRVCFADEHQDRLDLDRDRSNEQIYQKRFLSVLQHGLSIAGNHFSFLGFSHSSLRAQTCWFMRPFVRQGSLMFAQNLIQKLGNFSDIWCPAKCAARIGQAFSETTNAVAIDPAIVREKDDVTAGQHIFTDGCGTMLPQAWKLLRDRFTQQNQPTSYQIRYKGAKGMLTLDPKLKGQQICLRKSMIKFKGSPSDDLEVCGTNAHPLAFRLNRQLIKILEDLGVSKLAFHALQEQAIKRLQITATSKNAAVQFMIRHMSDSLSGLSRLLRALQLLRIDVTEDDFLRDVLGALLQEQLREIKFRSRIPVQRAHTLYGISDETGWLEANQVYVTWFDPDKAKNVFANGRVVVTRSPALHPGDIQLADAVPPPPDSSLRRLKNCVVFSQKGHRDLPSMLSGGDLDGDLYHVILDPSIIPDRSVPPAAYTPVQAMNIGREVTANDMSAFFVDFMENDVLGRVASLHQIMADREDDGTFAPDCLLLADLHSTAVDFSKSGVKVDVKRIPQALMERPDFMCPSASMKVEKGIKRLQEDSPQVQSKQKYRYYASEKVLGELYRAIDEDIFFQNLEDDASSIFSQNTSDSVLKEVLRWVRRYISNNRIKQWLATAKELREYYELVMQSFMRGYAVRRNEQITEKEVFAGSILGRTGAGSKAQRDQSESLKATFNRELRHMCAWMERQIDDEDDGYGFMSLATACLYVAVFRKSTVNNELKSFGWFAAGLCVPDLVKEQQENGVLRV